MVIGYFIDEFNNIHAERVEVAPTGQTTLEELNDKYSLQLDERVASRFGSDYNCMGFALGTYEWENIYDFKETRELDELEREDCLADCVSEITCFYPVREIELEDKIEEDEYRIAMKVATDDFHFAREMEDGTWYEKCGAAMLRPFDRDTLYNDWYSATGSTVYDSETVFFAVKKEQRA